VSEPTFASGGFEGRRRKKAKEDIVLEGQTWLLLLPAHSNLSFTDLEHQLEVPETKKN
jgi:hypothetical protein